MTTLLVFVDTDDVLSVRRAKVLVAQQGATCIHRDSSVLKDLLLIAKHRIVETPMTLMLTDDGATIARLRGVLSASMCDKILTCRSTPQG